MSTSILNKKAMEEIRAVADGLSNQELTARLCIREGTVKNYSSTIFEKGGLNHRTQAAIYYLTGICMYQSDGIVPYAYL